MSQTATRSIADHFAEQAARRPDAPALIWDGQPISYAELQGLADASFAELEAARLPTDRPIGVRAKKSPEAIALILACLRSGAPFLLPSIELAPETLAQLFAQAGTSQVISPHGPRSESAASLRALVDDARSEPEEGGLGSQSEWPPAGGGEDVTFMLTTSGSTGLPKIVPLQAAGVDAFTDWAAEQFEIKPGTVVANYAPLNFDLCLLDIWTTLKHGGTVALVDQDRATQGAYLADLVNDNQVNVLQAVPMLYRLLIDVNREDGRTFPSVRHVITTGDKIPPSSLAELPDAIPPRKVLQRVRLHRDERQPRPRVPRARRRQRPDEHPGRPADPRRDSPRAERGRDPARRHRHRRIHGMDAVPDPGIPQVVAERGEVRHARG